MIVEYGLVMRRSRSVRYLDLGINSFGRQLAGRGEDRNLCDLSLQTVRARQPILGRSSRRRLCSEANSRPPQGGAADCLLAMQVEKQLAKNPCDLSTSSRIE